MLANIQTWKDFLPNQTLPSSRERAESFGGKIEEQQRKKKDKAQLNYEYMRQRHRQLTQLKNEQARAALAEATKTRSTSKFRERRNFSKDLQMVAKPNEKNSPVKAK